MLRLNAAISGVLTFSVIFETCYLTVASLLFFVQSSFEYTVDS